MSLVFCCTRLGTPPACNATPSWRPRRRGRRAKSRLGARQWPWGQTRGARLSPHDADDAAADNDDDDPSSDHSAQKTLSKKRPCLAWSLSPLLRVVVFHGPAHKRRKAPRSAQSMQGRRAPLPKRTWTSPCFFIIFPNAAWLSPRSPLLFCNVFTANRHKGVNLLPYSTGKSNKPLLQSLFKIIST